VTLGNSICVTFLSAFLAIFVVETLKRAIIRWLEAGDLAQYALIDTIAALRSIEAVFDALQSTEIPQALNGDGLLHVPSSWLIYPPVLSCEQIVRTIDDGESAAKSILLHDKVTCFLDANREYGQAFEWLLDHAEEAGTLRLDSNLQTLRISLDRMQRHAKDALYLGYGLAERLNKLSRCRPAVLSQGDYAASAAVLLLGRPLGDLALRRQYYGAACTSHVHDPDEEHVRVRWSGAGHIKLEWTKKKGRHATTLSPSSEVVAIPKRQRSKESVCRNEESWTEDTVIVGLCGSDGVRELTLKSSSQR